MPKTRTTLCAITGVEVPLDDSFTLDLSAAHQRLRGLREQAAALERTVQNLGPQAVKLHDGREVRTRLTVTLGIAAAFDTGITKGLFIPWPEFQHGVSERWVQRMLHHPVHGPALRALPAEDRFVAQRLGRSLAGRLNARGTKPSLDLRLAVEWGVSVRLVHLEAPDAFAELIAAAAGRDLCAVGIPEPLHAEARALLTNALPDEAP